MGSYTWTLYAVTACPGPDQVKPTTATRGGRPALAMGRSPNRKGLLNWQPFPHRRSEDKREPRSLTLK